MRNHYYNALLFFPLWVVLSCNNVTSVYKKDSSTKNTQQDTLSQTKNTAIKTGLGETILLQAGEFFADLQYLGTDNNKSLLIFTSEDGNPIEIQAPAWSRSGNLLLQNNEEILLTKGTYYELIYTHHNREKNQTDSLNYLVDIAPYGFVFSDLKRYSSKSADGFYCPTKALGNFRDDITGNVLVCNKGNTIPSFNFILSGDNNEKETYTLECQKISSKVLLTVLPKAKQKAIFTFKDGEWVCLTNGGLRRVFRILEY
ncbi:MAG: hypothetical protein IT244_12010 [Bacteroidia bacterium]|nr:hypothetical protein [Bacteroidia bacterium]